MNLVCVTVKIKFYNPHSANTKILDQKLHNKSSEPHQTFKNYKTIQYVIRYLSYQCSNTVLLQLQIKPLKKSLRWKEITSFHKKNLTQQTKPRSLKTGVLNIIKKR